VRFRCGKTCTVSYDHKLDDKENGLAALILITVLDGMVPIDEARKTVRHNFSLVKTEDYELVFKSSVTTNS